MKYNNKLIPQLSVSTLIVMALTACGGGGGEGGSGGEGSNNDVNTEDSSVTGGDNAGSGGCVTFPRAAVGQIVKRELKDAKGRVTLTKETEIKAISNTSITQFIKGGIGGDSTNIQEFTIANNYQDITKETVTIFGFNFVTTYTPFQRIPIDKVCEGQTWTTTYTENDTDEVTNHSETYTIEAVNVPKTTKAGTFNTFRVKLEDIDIGGTIWMDIDSGYDVYSEFTLTSGEEGGSLELIEKNF